MASNFLGRMPSLAMPRPSFCVGCNAEGALIDDVLVGDQTESTKGEEPGPGIWLVDPDLRADILPASLWHSAPLGRCRAQRHLHTDFRRSVDATLLAGALELGGRDDAIAKLATADKIRPQGLLRRTELCCAAIANKRTRFPERSSNIILLKFHSTTVDPRIDKPDMSCTFRAGTDIWNIFQFSHSDANRVRSYPCQSVLSLERRFQ